MNYFILRSSVYPGKIYIRNWTIELFDFELLKFWLWPWEIVLLCHSKPCTRLHIYLLSYLFEDIRLWSFEILTLTFNLKGSSEVKNISAIRKFIHHFLSNFYRHFLSISYRFRDIDFKVFMVWPWPLTLRSHMGSRIFLPFESPYMTFYLTSIDTFSLSPAVFKIFDFKCFGVWPWTLTFRGHLGSTISFPFESPYRTSFLISIDTFFLSRTVFEIFDFKVFIQFNSIQFNSIQTLARANF